MPTQAASVAPIVGEASPSRPPPVYRGTGSALPRVSGRYVLFDLIGRGGMAEIYLARASTTEAGGARLVVVKEILPELSANPTFAEALVREAKLAAGLAHANIVQVFDLGRAPERDGARLFIAMEYVEGLDLNELLRRCARADVAVPIEFGLLVVCEVLRALDYAHRRRTSDGRTLGIVHRDVSPSNVLVSLEGEVKLCDFGIARANDGQDAIDADVIQGKAAYMSPEQARGEDLDARADVFSSGVILWELLAGRRLYRAPQGDAAQVLALARRADIPPLPTRGLPQEETLHAIVTKALAPDRNERFSSAGELLAELQQYARDARLLASPLRLGAWLSDHFGGAIVAARASRERAVKALERGPAVSLTLLASPPLATTAPQQRDAHAHSEPPASGGQRPTGAEAPVIAPATPRRNRRVLDVAPIAALLAFVALFVAFFYLSGS